MESRNQGLQIGRAVAALSVAYFHSYIALRAFPETAQIPIMPLKNWGFLGVNFFFAISGYVICLITARSSFSASSFAIKRIFRLFPMYWTVMAVVGFLVLIGKYRHESLGHFFYSMTLLPQNGAPAYDVSWTLERELVFYALAALTVPLVGIPGLAVVLASLAAAGWWLGNPWSYHFVSTIQADFLVGVLVFLVHGRTRFMGASMPIAAGIAWLAYTRQHDFAFSVSLCMSIILLGMVNLQLPWERWPLRWLVHIGNASYSIYLLHPLTFLVMVNIAARAHLPDWMCEPWRFITIAVCCIVSSVTWRIVELPCIRIGNSLSRRMAFSVDRADNLPDGIGRETVT